MQCHSRIHKKFKFKLFCDRVKNYTEWYEGMVFGKRERVRDKDRESVNVSVWEREGEKECEWEREREREFTNLKKDMTVWLLSLIGHPTTSLACCKLISHVFDLHLQKKNKPCSIVKKHLTWFFNISFCSISFMSGYKIKYTSNRCEMLNITLI